MIRAFAIASLVFASQAVAGESIVIPAQPYTLKCLEQYGAIEACIIGLVEVSRRLTVQRDGLVDINKQLVDRVTALQPAPEPRAKPMKRTGCRKKWRTLANGHRKYRCV